jgi:hypothetical protein
MKRSRGREGRRGGYEGSNIGGRMSAEGRSTGNNGRDDAHGGNGSCEATCMTSGLLAPEEGSGSELHILGGHA